MEAPQRCLLLLVNINRSTGVCGRGRTCVRGRVCARGHLLVRPGMRACVREYVHICVRALGLGD
jgi:hypothetical protein